jgi:hypothetical protein
MCVQFVAQVFQLCAPNLGSSAAVIWWNGASVCALCTLAGARFTRPSYLPAGHRPAAEAGRFNTPDEMPRPLIPLGGFHVTYMMESCLHPLQRCCFCKLCGQGPQGELVVVWSGKDVPHRCNALSLCAYPVHPPAELTSWYNLLCDLHSVFSSRTPRERSGPRLAWATHEAVRPCSSVYGRASREHILSPMHWVTHKYSVTLRPSV